MLPEKIADAALLAAEAPAGGVLPPRDDSIEMARLDLWADRPAVARQKLQAVARALGPRLQIQEGFRLLINCGDLPPAEAAAQFAVQAFGDTPGPLIATVRGEDVLDQLESLIAAGCRLEDHTNQWPITDERRPIARAWAAAPQSVVQSALEAGATIVVSRQATAEELGGANLEETLVSVDLADRYTLNTITPNQAMLSNLPSSLASQINCDTQDDGSVVVTAEAPSYQELEELAGRLQLAAGTGAFDQPLASCIQPDFVGAWIRVPAGLIEFGIETRSANEWSSES